MGPPARFPPVLERAESRVTRRVIGAADATAWTLEAPDMLVLSHSKVTS
ncbi:hypothetical protein [Streptomyces sp. NPDC016675]